MPSGGHNRKTSKELQLAATERSDRLLASDAPGRGDLMGLLHAWREVALVAVEELKSEQTVTIVNAGDQVQKHPGVTVLEAASKRIEALVVLLGRFEDDAPVEGVDDLPDDAPPRWTPEVV